MYNIQHLTCHGTHPRDSGMIVKIKRLCVDDTITHLTVSSESNTRQKYLNKLAKWEQMDDAVPSQQMRSPTNNKKTKTHKQLNFILHGHNCEYVSSANYFTVTITSDLKWNAHVQKICQQANRTIGFLKRNLNIVNSTVRPTVEHERSVWDPHLQKDINKLEMIQRRSARYVTNRYHNTSSVETMLQQLKWPTLEERRKKARLTLLYKVANGEVDN